MSRKQPSNDYRSDSGRHKSPKPLPVLQVEEHRRSSNLRGPVVPSARQEWDAYKHSLSESAARHINDEGSAVIPGL